jgi:hypothetical protein
MCHRRHICRNVQMEKLRLMNHAPVFYAFYLFDWVIFNLHFRSSSSHQTGFHRLLLLLLLLTRKAREATAAAYIFALGERERDQFRPVAICLFYKHSTLTLQSGETILMLGGYVKMAHLPSAGSKAGRQTSWLVSI